MASYEFNDIIFEHNSEIIGEIDNLLELSFVYKNGCYYIEYYDNYDEDYILIEIKDDLFPLEIENKQITLNEFKTFKKIIEV